ncbi:hypothetical protein ACNQFZ_13200 [Schinkia sp. CFF1]
MNEKLRFYYAKWGGSRTGYRFFNHWGRLKEEMLIKILLKVPIRWLFNGKLAEIAKEIDHDKFTKLIDEENI